MFIWYLASLPFWVTGAIFAFNAYGWMTEVGYARKRNAGVYSLVSLALWAGCWLIAALLLS